jgi:hypothetical protein
MQTAFYDDEYVTSHIRDENFLSYGVLAGDELGVGKQSYDAWPTAVPAGLSRRPDDASAGPGDEPGVRSIEIGASYLDDESM